MMNITNTEQKRKQAKARLKKALAEFTKAFNDWDSLPPTSLQRADIEGKREDSALKKYEAYCDMKQAYKKQTEAFDRILELYKHKPSA